MKKYAACLFLTALYIVSALHAEEGEPLPLLTPSIRRAVGDVFRIRFLAPPGNTAEPVLSNVPEGIRLLENDAGDSAFFHDRERSLNLQALAAGRYIIEFIQVGPMRTSSVLIEIADAQNNVPFSARWNVLQKSVFQGQSIPIVLEITHVDSFIYPDAIDFRTPAEGLFEEVGGFGSVTSMNVGDKVLYAVPVAAFLFTSPVSDVMTLFPAEIRAMGQVVVTPEVMIDLLPIPPVASGAVGDFVLSVEADKTIAAVDDIVTVQMAITGVGNLPVLSFPHITLENMTEVNRDEQFSLQVDKAGVDGYVGSRELSIQFTPVEAGVVGKIIVDDMEFFHPKRQEIMHSAGRALTIHIPESHLSSNKEFSGELLTVGVLSNWHWIQFFRIRVLLLLFLVPALYCILMIAYKKVRRLTKQQILLFFSMLLLSAALFPTLNTERIRNANSYTENNQWDTAAKLYDEELQENPYHAGLHYNRSLIAAFNNNPALAVYHARRAVRLIPQNRMFRASLADIEAVFQVGDQAAIPRYIRPDILYALIFFLWAASWIVLSLKKSVGRIIAVMSMWIVILCCLVGFWWVVQTQNVPEGTIMQEIALRRIPDVTAKPWVVLYPAASVMVELSYAEFHLVMTSSGVTGWVPKTSVRYHREE